MSLNDDLLEQKELFLQENELFTELEEDLKAVGNPGKIDLTQNEIWLLQCPKGMNVTDLKNHKLKIPGRTSIKDTEAISMEYNNGKEQLTFAYYNRQKNYSLRLLPVSGTIVIRNQLKAAETITSERAEECCSPVKPVPLPSAIRVRHPLLGAQYNDKIHLDESIKKRLQEADEDSAKILKKSMSRKHITSLNTTDTKKDVDKLITLSSADDDEVEFVSEKKLKRKKKRKHSESLDGNSIDDKEAKIKNKKLKRTSTVKETVPEDLQWLQNI